MGVGRAVGLGVGLGVGFVVGFGVGWGVGLGVGSGDGAGLHTGMSAQCPHLPWFETCCPSAVRVEHQALPSGSPSVVQAL